MAYRGTAAIVLSLITVVGMLGVVGALHGPASPTSAPSSAGASVVPSSLSAPVSPTSPGTASTGAAPTVAERSSLQQSVVSELAASHVPQKAIYLPNFQGGGVMHGDVVSPITHTAPAPMGLGDFGVRNTSGTATPYVLDSTSWEGTVTMNSGTFFYLDNDGPDPFGIQLNTVLTNVTVYGSTHDDFWIQDVMYFTPSQDQVQMLDNIWNFSNPSTIEPGSTFLDYGGNPTDSAYYYDFGPSFTATFPWTVHLYTNATLANVSAPGGGPTYETSQVTFGYDIVGAGNAQISNGVFDTVDFASNELTSSAPHLPMPHFQVNGGHLTPTNFLLYDSELMIGGPGGGSTTQVWALNGSMSLAYLSASTYVNDPTAWDVGTDTGETSEGIAESYTTPGTVDLDAGPSLVMPFWNATPSGNAGQLTVSGTIAPDNAFLFVSEGAKINNTTAAWAPFLPGGTYEFQLPGGDYTGVAMLENHDSKTVTFLGGAGTKTTVDIALTADTSVGVDTPMFAWNNYQLANLSYAGSGTVSSPYLLYNDQVTPFLPYFGEENDFLFQVFPGLFIVDTTAYWVLESPPTFLTTLSPGVAAQLASQGLPDTNQLQMEVYDSSHGSIIDGSDIGGWIYGAQFSFPQPFYPDGEIVLWGDTGMLIANNVFEDQGVGIVLLQGSGNTIFGNEFLNGLLTSLTFPAQFGIWEFESGDLIYNNAFDTSVTAFSPSYNMYNGNGQINQNNWNLSGWRPATTVSYVNGIALAGSVIGSAAVCGNWWWDYTPGEALPYNEPYDGGAPFIVTGGDYCPFGPEGAIGYEVSFSESGLASGSWTITLSGVSATAAAGHAITFAFPNGTWSWTVDAVAGMIATPASGSVSVNGASTGAVVTFSTSTGTGSRQSVYLASVSESGLPAGTAWTVTVGGAPYALNGSSLTLSETNGSYPYSIGAVTDYRLGAGGSGTLVVAGGPTNAYAVFSADPGWINATVDPIHANVSVNGTSIPLSFGGFSLSEPVGTYAIMVWEAGYATYINNITVSANHGSSFSITLQSLSTGTTSTGGGSSSSSGLSSSQFQYLLIGLVVVAAAIIVAALLIRGRGGAARSASPSAPPPQSPPGAQPPYME